MYTINWVSLTLCTFLVWLSLTIRALSTDLEPLCPNTNNIFEHLWLISAPFQHLIRMEIKVGPVTQTSNCKETEIKPGFLSS